ncbi:hypothetical protein GHT06_015184 [Daphnia sinensis]|uniref:Integrase catalytic domain-containing protein n=1 Tax=Daphnia sinensis TaxID=1820382 RepID=A0AAD5PVW2_9CRUS|nr:hypothetical protein GHT06_015184 [Daphnia sinensis]
MKNQCHYIPHFGVFKDSITTPLRIVYDCSCKTPAGVCLNDCLDIGPPLQNDILAVLLRFRVHQICLTADIEKAFHQVGLHENDRDYVRFLWLKNPLNPKSDFEIYRFRVIPFGASCSPFILLSVIKKHLQLTTSPEVADINRNIYVDNLISGCKDQTEAVAYYHEANRLLSGAGLNLQSWGSNCSQVTTTAVNEKVVDESALTKVLGLGWRREDDTLHLPQVHLAVTSHSASTKRDILRSISGVYVPLGFINPLTILARILIQEIGRLKLGWDETLPLDLVERWQERPMQSGTIALLTATQQTYYPADQPFASFCQLKSGELDRSGYQKETNGRCGRGITKQLQHSIFLTTSIILRFVENIKLKDKSRTSWRKGYITAPELQAAEKRWILETQEQYFSNELRYFTKPEGKRPTLCLNDCVTCRRIRGTAYTTPNHTPLPTFRSSYSFPFTMTGVDFTGSFPLRGPKEAPKADRSAYILLFTCASSRVIHLEVVEDMTTVSFLETFRCFVSHHSRPSIILSDNAKNFEKAAKTFQKIFRDPVVLRQLSDQQIEWRFIPKRAPCAFRALIADAELVLNDRPLEEPSSYVEDEESLCPAHLMYGRRLNTLPYNEEAAAEILDPSYATESNELKRTVVRHQLRHQALLKQFKKRFLNSYLPALREHHQATKRDWPATIKESDVVLVHDEKPRKEWKMAFVENLIRSHDGKIRAAEIRTAKGKTNRPISKLYPLQVSEPASPVIESAPPYSTIPVSPTSRPTRKCADRARAAMKNIFHQENNKHSGRGRMSKSFLQSNCLSCV